VVERTAGSRTEPGDRLSEIAELLRGPRSGGPDAERLVRLAAAVGPGGAHVSLVLAGSGRRCETLAASDDTARRLDAAQVQFGGGPVLESVDGLVVNRLVDLQSDGRWPGFAAAAATEGVGGVLTGRVRLNGELQAALTFYVDGEGAITDADVDLTTVLAALAGAAVAEREQRRRADNLVVALESSRQIGMAIGILMARELLTADQAFERLRDESQRRHRKLRELAVEVTSTGELGPA
jgi:hypothetical protein